MINFDFERDISCWLSQQGSEKMVKQKTEKIENSPIREDMMQVIDIALTNQKVITPKSL